MALQGQGFELTAISLFGPRPVDAVHIDLSDGLSILYGLNGSGKSTILRETEAVLRGLGPNAVGGVSSSYSCLHVRLTELNQNPEEFERSPFEDSVVAPLMPSSEDVEIPSHSTRFERWQWLLNFNLNQELGEDWIWDDAPLSHQGDVSLSLVPTGTYDEPSWGVYYSVALLETEWAEKIHSQERLRNLVNKARTTERVHKSDVELGRDPVGRFGLTPWTKPSTAGDRNPVGDLLHEWPKNLPLPVVSLGEVNVAPAHIISDKGSILDTRDATNNLLVALAEQSDELIDIADASETRLNPLFLRSVEALESEANNFLELTGPHPFQLRLELKSPHEWFVGEVPEWSAVLADGTELGLGRLSGAELRWALAALQWATSGLDTTRPQMFIMDEPERGLHRMREAELPTMLRNLCTRSENFMVFAASHAPSFLDVRVGARLHHVSRLPGLPTRLKSIDVGSSALLTESAESLGLNPSDLLQLTRVFVLVEGVHDEIVLKSSIGEDVRRAGGRIIPISGASHARSIADARILFDATTASIVFVVDNVLSGPTLDIWKKATEQYVMGQRKAAKSTLARLSRIGNGQETLWLRELGERAVDSNVLHRIKPFGLSKRDILCYLPTSPFGLTGADWDQLSAAYEEAKAKRLTKENFKTWLSTKRGAKFSRATVQAAAECMEPPLPREFSELALTIQGLGLLGPLDDLENLV